MHQTIKTKFLFVIGIIAAAANGFFHVANAFVNARSFADMSSNEHDFFLLRETALNFLYIGLYVFFMTFLQNLCLDIAAQQCIQRFRFLVFQGLLRQDAAFFDLHNINDFVLTINGNALVIRRGIGSKLGEGVRGVVIIVSGFIYAFSVSWRLSLVVFVVGFPYLGISSTLLMKLTQNQSTEATKGYAVAGRKA